MRTKFCLIGLLALLPLTNSLAQLKSTSNLRELFRDPPFEYRAIFPFLGAGGTTFTESRSVKQQLDDIYNTYGFGGVIVSPTADIPFVEKKTGVQPGYIKHVGNGLQPTLPAGASPWTMTLPEGALPYSYKQSETKKDTSKPLPLPGYLSKEYFAQLREILDYSKQSGRKVIWYDEVGYPSGIANHTTPEKYYRKLLDKTEEVVKGPCSVRKLVSRDGILMAAVAMNTKTLERINLSTCINNNILNWKAPAGEWKVMLFYCVTAQSYGTDVDYHVTTDYMDKEAVSWFIDKVYEPHAKEVGNYFGNTLYQTFYDDVGLFDDEKTWTVTFNEKFKERTGIDPALYYPALWENIGPETDAARIAFFDTRSELLADGFPKLVTDWGNRNGIEVSGHCPGNYDPQPVDMNGDPFKFYRAQPIPMVDVIFAYPTGRDGFKLISDGADFYDKPIVAAETFNSFAPAGLKAGYRRLMELYIRGINRLMGSGIPVTDGADNPTAFSEWVGRSSMLLQGGRRVSDIALFYPIADLEAFYRFDAPEYTAEMRWGTFIPDYADFMGVGEMLLGQVHRDFTFLHPDFLLSDKVTIDGSTLKLTNTTNSQNYKVLLLPGQKVISLEALKKIKVYYDAGGIVLATSMLPSKASGLVGNNHMALANDKQVQAIIKEMFGIDSTAPMPQGVPAIRKNNKHGKAVFIAHPEAQLLTEILGKLNVAPDVFFEGNPAPMSAGGLLSYIHKEKDNQEIYYFANSSDDRVDTFVQLRGKIRPELWNPSDGKISSIAGVTYIMRNGIEYTRFPLKLDAVTAAFIVSQN